MVAKNMLRTSEGTQAFLKNNIKLYADIIVNNCLVPIILIPISLYEYAPYSRLPSYRRPCTFP